MDTNVEADINKLFKWNTKTFMFDKYRHVWLHWCNVCLELTNGKRMSKFGKKQRYETKCDTFIESYKSLGQIPAPEDFVNYDDGLNAVYCWKSTLAEDNRWRRNWQTIDDW